MTNREKLIQVLRDNTEYELRHYPDDNYVQVSFNYKAMADALIEAGLVVDSNPDSTCEDVLEQSEKELVQEDDDPCWRCNRPICYGCEHIGR